MALVLTSPPALEPVALAEAKAHLRVGHGDEDALITRLITAARAHLESTLTRAFVTQGWSLWLDAWPAGGIVRLPLAPVREIAAVRIFDTAGVVTSLTSAIWFLDAVSHPARLVAQAGNVWPRPGRRANGIEVAFSAGHGDLASEVPEELRQAILLLVAHWYENREPADASATVIPLPHGIAELIAPFRERRI